MREEKLKGVIESAIDQGICSACVCGWINSSGDRDVKSFGTYTGDADSHYIQRDSLFDVASVTKTAPTALLAHIALERGLCTLDTPLIDSVPEFSSSWCENVTFRHLLTQTLDFDIQMSALKNLSPKEVLDAVYNAPLRRKPGTSFFYCNTTSILLGVMVERLLGQSLDSAAEKYVFSPLEMNSSYFRPKESLTKRIVPTEKDQWRKKDIRGEVHDESAWVLSEIMTPGAAGLFTTGDDLLNVVEMVLGSGMFRGKRIFEESSVQSFYRNQIPELDLYAGLGWELNQSIYMGSSASKSCIGKTGFTGTVIMVDPEIGKGLVLLTNYTWPMRKPDREQINGLRSAIADLVFSD